MRPVSRCLRRSDLVVCPCQLFWRVLSNKEIGPFSFSFSFSYRIVIFLQNHYELNEVFTFFFSGGVDDNVVPSRLSTKRWG